MGWNNDFIMSRCWQETGAPQLLQPAYFAPKTPDEADFLNSYMLPFFERMERAIRHPFHDISSLYHGVDVGDTPRGTGNQNWIVFAEPHVDTVEPVSVHLVGTMVCCEATQIVLTHSFHVKANSHTGALNLNSSASGYALAPHYYDGMQLLIKTFLPWLSIDTVHPGIGVGRARAKGVHENALASIKHRDNKVLVWRLS